MRESLWLVGLTHSGKVTEVRFVPPRRAVTLRMAELILELPGGHAPPPIHAHLRPDD